MMELLLTAGADPNAVHDESGAGFIDLAVRDGAGGAVRALLAAGASIDRHLWTALLLERDDVIGAILQGGGDPAEPGPEGEDPLAYCLSRERYRAAGALLRAGADPNVPFDDDESWLARAVRAGNRDTALLLINGGASVKDETAADGHTLLGWAIAHQMTDVVEALLRGGADPDFAEPAPARSGFRELFDSTTFRYHLKVDRKIRPVMLAAAHRDQEILQMLVDAGANGRAYTPKYLSAAIIGSWYKDSKIQQTALLGAVPDVQPRKAVIDLSSQKVTFYENGVAVYSARCSSGKSGYRTPTGEYVVSDKHRHHTSSIYGSSMPYFQRLSYSAFGFHQGYVPNYPASHGCIRLPQAAASHLFGKLKVGDLVVIQQ